MEPNAVRAEYLRREIGIHDRSPGHEQAREAPQHPYDALPGVTDLDTSTVGAFMTDQ